MNFDKCFIGASGITLDNGLSTSNIDVAEINRIVIEKSKEVYFLADSTKIGNDSRYVFAELNDCNKFITTDQAEVDNFDPKKLIVVKED
jgi:DeoR/GlpR family transcriptional regulator of sugar metabolism